MSSTWLVRVRFPDGTESIDAKNLTWNGAQHHAAGLRSDYSYANGGAKSRKVASRTWSINDDLPGPRTILTIENAARTFGS